MAQTHLREAKIAFFGTLALLSFLALCLRGLPKLSAALKWACSAKHAVPHDALWHAVSEKMLANKVRQYHCLMHFFCFLALVGPLVIVVHLILEEERWHSRVQDAVAVALPLLSVPACIFPKVINSRTIDAHYVLMMLVFTVNVAPFAAASTRLTAPMIVSNISVAALNITRRSIATQRLPLLPVCNALFVAAACKTILVHGRAYIGNILLPVATQALFIGLVVLGAHVLEATFTATLRHGLQLEEVKELYGAACALLRSFCESTVELDEEGAIVEDQQDFCSFLMRGSHNSLTGKRLADLLAEEDRDIFEERLREPRMRKVGLAEALPVTMRDAYSNPLRLEFFWFDFKKVDGKRNFMVGIKELTDCCPGELVPLPADVKPEEGVVEVTSTNSDSAILVVNAMEADFPIQGQSRCLELQVGKLPHGATLATFVKKPERFLPWVQRAALEETTEKVEVTLLMPYGKFRARCCVVKSDAGLEALGLLFTRITAAGCRRPSLGLGTPNGVSSQGSTQAVSL